MVRASLSEGRRRGRGATPAPACRPRGGPVRIRPDRKAPCSPDRGSISSWSGRWSPRQNRLAFSHSLSACRWRSRVAAIVLSSIGTVSSACSMSSILPRGSTDLDGIASRLRPPSAQGLGGRSENAPRDHPGPAGRTGRAAHRAYPPCHRTTEVPNLWHPQVSLRAP